MIVSCCKVCWEQVMRGVAVERKHQLVLCQDYLTTIIAKPVLRYFVEISEVVNFSSGVSST